MKLEWSPDAVVLPDGLTPWILRLKAKVGGQIFAQLQSNTDHLDQHLECAEVSGLPGAFLCAAFYQKDMNEVFTRMGLFMGAGKGVRENTLVAHQDPTLINYKKLVAGHNLPGPVVQRFFAAAQDRNAHESSFAAGFLNAPLVQKYGSAFYVIGLEVQNMKTYQSVVTHEILHARYFLDSRYREIVREFWRTSLSPADREEVTAQIGQVYNVEQEDLVIDEFQAYLLQDQAELDRMKTFVNKFQLALQKKLVP